MEQYIILGNLTRRHFPETGQEEICFQLCFADDWVILERKLESASFGLARLAVELVDADDIDVSGEVADPDVPAGNLAIVLILPDLLAL